MAKIDVNKFLLNDKISFIDRNIKLAVRNKQPDSFYKRVHNELSDAITSAFDNNYQVQIGYLCALKEVLYMCNERDLELELKPYERKS